MRHHYSPHYFINRGERYHHHRIYGAAAARHARKLARMRRTRARHSR